ncbi:prolyl 3-hydroxylase 2 isoform X1 [Erythrolamprus reginae]|uniref:prolyl 3-hydroxylase 2 isoform X1 n=1 Tax=Erythrolamprus reginae TaxID=121349 RepID=UPI00396CCA23
MASGLRLVLVLVLAGRASCAPEPPFEALYAAGLEAHRRADFAGAARWLEEALSAERRQREKRAGCGLRCRREEPLEPGGDPLPWAGAFLRRARCLRACLGAPGAAAAPAGQEVRADFQRRLPYSYLHRAYVQLNELDKAADAAHTFFAANPEHLEMQQDLDNYKTLSGKVDLVDREAQPHMENYLAGIWHYEREEYDLAIVHLEQALEDYEAADAQCQVLCEGPQRFEGYEYLDYKADLYEAIAEHCMQVLLCQHECVRQLATRPGRLSPINNFLPLHYDFLQFAYFRVGNYIQALQCTRTYLLFHPDDEDVLENEEHYKRFLGGFLDLDDVKPREEVVTFLRRHRLEADLLEAGASILGFSHTEPNYWNITGSRHDRQRDPSMLQDHQANEAGSAPPEQDLSTMRCPLREGGPLLFNEVQVVYNSQQLNGTQRVLLDNVISPSECQELEHIANNILLAGDGYRGKTSPHTPNEKFEGATILNALKFGYEGQIPLKSARLFYDVSEKARKIVESYFMLNSTLYFSYTHLVCRTALSGHQERRNDLSHPIHADNCLLDSEANECWKEPPAYTFRDYSALLYINSDFEGGEFIFTEMDAKTVTERLHADEIIALLDHQQSFSPTNLDINPKDEL